MTDGSAAGQWRLPNIAELEGLVDTEKYGSALPAGHPFSGFQSYYYWSSSTVAGGTLNAWIVSMSDGSVGNRHKSNFVHYVCPVRAGQ